eukprot:GHVS01104089.1.p1 GENE.GHVS01104089.1~~GHVS01104089.1.p1  ORF type:complete len:342 (+),score=79.41 GHVS01104089.1:187-1212(+)
MTVAFRRRAVCSCQQLPTHPPPPSPPLSSFISCRYVRTNRHSFKSHQWPNFLQFHGTPKGLSVSGHKKSLLGVVYSAAQQTKLMPSQQQLQRADVAAEEEVVEAEDMAAWTDSEAWRERRQTRHPPTVYTQQGNTVSKISSNRTSSTSSTATSATSDKPLQSASRGLVLHYGDISRVRCDAAVLPADLLSSSSCGGLSPCKLTALAGPDLFAHIKSTSPPPTGQCLTTPGFASNANVLIHCALPSSSSLLPACYHNSLQLAANTPGVSSLALPLLTSLGAASLYSLVHICLQSVADWTVQQQHIVGGTLFGGDIRRIVFCVHTDEAWKIFNRLLRVVFKTL